MTGRENRAAWADYWQKNKGPGEGGCLPQALVELDAAQRGIWQGFARALRRGSRVLDLGTGDGAVLRKMAALRGNLQLTGVDSSPSLPPSPKGIKLRPGTAIEALPFRDGFFDAVTSQFGYEYGETGPASREVARVLKPGGRLLFMLHRADGPIVAHNAPRREALLWAVRTSGWLDKARALVRSRTLGPLPTPPAFRGAVEEARRLFPTQPVAVEVLEAVRQTLELGRNAPPQEALEVLADLEAKADNEIARIESLQRAACDPARVETIVAELRASGLDIDTPGSACGGSSGQAFAWLVAGGRPA